MYMYFTLHVSTCTCIIPVEKQGICNCSKRYKHKQKHGHVVTDMRNKYMHKYIHVYIQYIDIFLLSYTLLVSYQVAERVQLRINYD